ncbi:MAG: hypothetical protein QOK36_4223 [Gaiellales bacterium]|nr:hypothetical protein [Gaiellales bacterium]
MVRALPVVKRSTGSPTSRVQGCDHSVGLAAAEDPRPFSPQWKPVRLALAKNMRILRFRAAASISMVLVGGSPVASSAAPHRAAMMVCTPSAVILKSSRVGSEEVQAKALNDRGDIVGFADNSDPKDKAIHAILWRNGKAGSAVDLGVLPGYVASEAYGVNNNRVVFGLLYDKKKRTFPFRWKAGRMTVLKGPNGRRQQADVPDRNTINDRGQMAGTLIIAGQRQAVRWSPDGKATLLPALPGHTWTNVWSINSDGVVSGWSRKQPNEDGENNPVIWDTSGKVVPLKTAPGRADGAAQATNRSGLTVGYLGNLGTDGIPGAVNTDPERDNAVVWHSRTARPRLLGRPALPHAYAELVDINDRGQGAGMSGNFTKTGFPLFAPAIWRTGWTSLRPLPIPEASQKSRVVIAMLNDINNRGDIVGDIYGLDAKDFSKVRRIDAVLWRCPFSR